MPDLNGSHIADSELILNPDGSIYHLNLLPGELAETIILVGDPKRVYEVSKHFDRIEVQKTKRELVTHTGTIGSMRLSVVGTGMGAGNIDIVMNELDAVFNIDFKQRVVKEKQQKLRFIRLGTSGALQPHIPVDSCLISAYGVGLDGLVLYYNWQHTADEADLQSQSQKAFARLPVVSTLYAASGSTSLCNLFQKNNLGQLGITLTCPGFYGAQDRRLRIPVSHPDFLSLARQVRFRDLMMTNLEMETAAIYGMARLLNHDACSISAIIANRDAQVFSSNPEKTVCDMIEKALDILSSNILIGA